MVEDTGYSPRNDVSQSTLTKTGSKVVVANVTTVRGIFCRDYRLVVSTIQNLPGLRRSLILRTMGRDIRGQPGTPRVIFSDEEEDAVAVSPLSCQEQGGAYF